jgi:environmental stress-induced protein Ves
MNELIPIWSLPAVPWKNGAGVTRILCSGYGWRISIAQVSTECVFSCFPRTDRQSVVIGGGSLRLRNDEEAVELRPGVASAYAGDSVWHCEMLGAPATVLNVMCERNVTACEVKIGPRLSLSGAPQGTIVMLPVCCEMAYAVSSGETGTAPGYTALVCEGPVIVDCSSMEDSSALDGYLVGIALQNSLKA